MNKNFFNNADLFNKLPPSYYLNRSNHVGTQSISTIDGLQEILDASTGTAATKAYVNQQDQYYYDLVLNNNYIKSSSTGIGLYWNNGVLDVSATSVDVNYIDGSLAHFIRNTSIGYGLYWNNGYVDVSITADVSKGYLDMYFVKSYKTYINPVGISTFYIPETTHHLGPDFAVSVWEGSEPLYPHTYVDGTGNLTLTWVPGTVVGILKILLIGASGVNATVDNSVYATVDMLNLKFNEASIGAGFEWINGYLEPSAGVGDVTKAYVDGSLAFRDASINYLIDTVYSKVQTDASFALKTDVNSSLGLYLKKSGDVMSGPLTINSGLHVSNDVSIFGKLYVAGDTAFKGNIYVDGSMYVSNVEKIDISTAYITLNAGLVGEPPITLQSGLVINRGTKPPYVFGYNELEQTFRIGISYLETSTHYSDASTQSVATREDDPINHGIAIWNASLYRFDTSAGFTFTPNIGLKVPANLEVSNDVSIFGSLSIDGSTLFVDSVNKRIGINASIINYPLVINVNAGFSGLNIQSTVAGTRPGIRQEAILPATGVAYNMFEGYIGNNSSLLTRTGVIGVLGTINTYPTPSSTTFMYFGSAPNADYTHYALALYPSNWAAFTSGVNMVGPVAINKTNPLYNLDISGNFHTSDGAFIDGSLNMNNKRIQSLADPVDPSDATNRWYVDVSLVDRDLAQPWTLDNSTLSPSNADYDIQLSSIQMQINGGAMTLVDMDVTNDTSGNINSYSFNMDGCTAFRIESIADSSSISQKYIVETADYHYIGEPSADNSWRWFIDPSTDLQFQKRIRGTWTYAGKFSI